MRDAFDDLTAIRWRDVLAGIVIGLIVFALIFIAGIVVGRVG